MTPLPAFAITPLKKAEPEAAEGQVPGTGSAEKIGGNIGHLAATGSQKLMVYRNGVVSVGRILFSVTKRMGGRIVIVGWGLEGVIFATLDGEIIAEYGWPSAGATYVGMDKARTRFGGDGQNGELSTMS